VLGSLVDHLYSSQHAVLLSAQRKLQTLCGRHCSIVLTWHVFLLTGAPQGPVRKCCTRMVALARKRARFSSRHNEQWMEDVDHIDSVLISHYERLRPNLSPPTIGCSCVPCCNTASSPSKSIYGFQVWGPGKMSKPCSIVGTFGSCPRISTNLTSPFREFACQNMTDPSN
jgi:hypothetical protein